MSKFALYADDSATLASARSPAPLAIRESVRPTPSASRAPFVLLVLLSAALAMVAGSVFLAL